MLSQKTSHTSLNWKKEKKYVPTTRTNNRGKVFTFNLSFYTLDTEQIATIVVIFIFISTRIFFIISNHHFHHYHHYSNFHLLFWTALHLCNLLHLSPLPHYSVLTVRALTLHFHTVMFSFSNLPHCVTTFYSATSSSYLAYTNHNPVHLPCSEYSGLIWLYGRENRSSSFLETHTPSSFSHKVTLVSQNVFLVSLNLAKFYHRIKECYLQFHNLQSLHNIDLIYLKCSLL